MRKAKVELVYFPGCPHAEGARENLAAVLRPASWVEWDLSAAGTPDRFRRFGSPTVLVDGHDVTGEDGGNAAMACRADGAPHVDLIRKALEG